MNCGCGGAIGWRQIRREMAKMERRNRIRKAKKAGDFIVYWLFAGTVSLAFVFCMVVIVLSITNRHGYLLNW